MLARKFGASIRAHMYVHTAAQSFILRSQKQDASSDSFHSQHTPTRRICSALRSSFVSISSAAIIDLCLPQLPATASGGHCPSHTHTHQELSLPCVQIRLPKSGLSAGLPCLSPQGFLPAEVCHRERVGWKAAYRKEGGLSHEKAT